ncbi:MAG: radical SAM protein [Candidatus Bathyarchaeia archaeon]
MSICNDQLPELLSESRHVSDKKTGKTLTVYHKAFQPVSITGRSCSLNCKHCSQHYLRHMLPASDPEKLLRVCKKLAANHAPGVLLSGGSRKDGTIPLDQFADTIRKIKRETGLIISAHTGPVDYEKAKMLVEAGLDIALLDVVGSAETTRGVYGVEITPDDYSKTLSALNAAGIPNISPHICVGLHFGQLKGEAKALEIVSHAKVSTIAIVVLIPTKETAMADILPSSPEDVAKVISIANLMFPNTSVSLGCVRPGKDYREKIDELAIRAGIGKLAIPTENSLRTARNLGLDIKSYNDIMCCSVDESQLK